MNCEDSAARRSSGQQPWTSCRICESRINQKKKHSKTSLADSGQMSENMGGYLPSLGQPEEYWKKRNDSDGKINATNWENEEKQKFLEISARRVGREKPQIQASNSLLAKR